MCDHFFNKWVSLKELHKVGYKDWTISLSWYRHPKSNQTPWDRKPGPLAISCLSLLIMVIDIVGTFGKCNTQTHWYSRYVWKTRIHKHTNGISAQSITWCLLLHDLICNIWLLISAFRYIPYLSYFSKKSMTSAQYMASYFGIFRNYCKLFF